MTVRRTQRFPIMLTTDEVTAIEGYRWANKIKTQAQAMRELIEKGLAADAAKSEGASAPTPAPSVAT